MRRSLVLALVAASALTGCSSGKAVQTSPQAAPPTASPTPSDSPTPSPVPCTASAGGTKALSKKPVYTLVAGPGPTTTTTSDIVCGTGDQATKGSNVVVQYLEVSYANGHEIDSSWASGSKLPFTVGQQVPDGLSTGTTGMRVGGRRLIVVPPSEGYGDAGPVPGGTIAYIIDLLAINP